MGSPGDDLWLTPAPHLPSGLGQSLMLIKGWLLANRLKGCGVLAAGVESDGWLFVAPMVFVLCCSLNMVGLVLVSRGRLVGVARDAPAGVHTCERSPLPRAVLMFG